jgi:uncharacterized membrane protein
MACDVTILSAVPLFSLLDADELAVLAEHLEVKLFASRQRIYKIGDAARAAYVIVTGAVDVTTVDEDYRDVLFDQPAPGDFFGFASMLDGTPHQTNAVAREATECLVIDRDDITTLIQRKPHAAMDMMTVLGQRLHAAQGIIRSRAARNPNDLIAAESTWGDHVADRVASFGGSWAFILTCLGLLAIYATVNIALRGRAWDPYPFILLNLMLSMLAALQAPVIMMSQNRQDSKDRVRGELDYEVNRRAAADIQDLARKLNLVLDKIGDVDDAIRSPEHSAATQVPGEVTPR